MSEVVADRTAFTSTWRNSDGSLSVRHYFTPHFYKGAGGTWSKIDTKLAPSSQEGWWQSGSNSWSVAFGPAGSTGGAVRFTRGGHTFGFAPQGVADPALTPSVSGDSATYKKLWPQADLAEQVNAVGVKEDLVLKGPDAPSSFSFQLSGATAVPNRAGGVDLRAGGTRLGTLPAPTVSIAKPGPKAAAKAKKPLDRTAESRARMTVAGDVVTVSVSPEWLAQLPASAFPVVIDPTYAALSPAAGWTVSSVSDSGQTLPGVLQLGQDAGGSNWRPEVYIPAPAPPSVESGDQPYQFSYAWFLAQSDSQLTDVPLYGLSGSSTFAQIPGGQLLETLAGPQAGFQTAYAAGSPQWSYFADRSDGWWLGMGTPSSVAGPAGSSLATFSASSLYFMAQYEQQPKPTTISSPADGSVVSSTTPTLTAPVTPPTGTTGCQVSPDGSSTYCDEGSYYYDFKVSTSSDGTGAVIDSGWLFHDGPTSDSPATPVTWAVPPGSLRDGVTYYAKVLTAYTPIYSGDVGYEGNLKPSSSPSVRFTVKQRLGNGGPSPTDTIGAPPAGTTTPAKGSPAPGVPTATETVNLLTGDLSVSLGTPTMQTVSGPAGVALSYDSAKSSIAKGGNYGLTAQYYPDSGTHTFTGQIAGQRTDASVNASWNNATPPIGGLQTTATAAATPFLVRWTGALSLPAGTWQLGGATTGGMRVFLNGSSNPVYDDWSGAAGTATPSYGTVTSNGSQVYQVEVDSWVSGHKNTTDTVQLWAKNTEISDPAQVSQWVVPSSWLTPTATGVPAGWNLLANPATAQWFHADDEGSQVVVQGASGETASFTLQAPGYYQAQAGDDDRLNVDGAGHLQLATSDNQLYTFNPDGSLAAMTSAADDRHPAALRYTYSGTPALLRAITDPVSARSITLSYGGDAACPAADPAPAGMLCKVAFWDGTATTFGYNANGQIASVTDPMGQTDLLAYDSDNRLADIRDALAGNYVAAGGSAGTAADCPSGDTGLSVTPVDTQICYDSSGRVATVTQPAPTPGAARPARTYTYATDHTDTAIAGFAPASGYESRTFYDAQGRIVQQLDSAGHATTTVWANATTPGGDCTGVCGTDQAVVTATPAGLQTSTVYDVHGNVTDTYGPAPLACFAGGWPTGVTPKAPVVGYLPVSNPQDTSGCGVAKIPHTRNGYDDGMAGLAATFWANGQAAGPAASHSFNPGGSQSAALCGTSGGTSGGMLCAHWDAGSPPTGSDTAGQWSMRLTGTISLATAGSYTVGAATSQAITVNLDGTPLVHDGADVTGFAAGTTRTTTGTGTQLAAGIHAIQVDFQGSATQLNEFAVTLTPPGGTSAVIPNAVLDPAYSLKTSVTDPDGVVTTTKYADGTVGPQYGLATSTTVGAGSSTALTTTTAYEAPSDSTYLRKTSRTLPAGKGSTYTYYTGTAGPLAAVCGIAADTPQGGNLRSETDPAPASSTPAREQQYVYDAAGHMAGHRVGAADGIDTAPWECTRYDANGRMTSQSWPAFNGAPARTATYTYDVGGNPLTTSVADAAGTITTTVDLLGRLVSYTDVAGKTSTTTFNQAGQVTATTGPQGAITNTYDPDSGTLATVTSGTNLLATAHYDSTTGRLATVTYADGTTGTLGYDSQGDQNSLVFTSTATSTLVTGDQTTRSPGKRVTTELEAGNGNALTNPNPAGSATYTYDGAGRLATAYLPGATAAYGYGANPAGENCADPGMGANSNRTSITITPAGGTAVTTGYCYNSADQLVSTTVGATTDTGYAYDTHGNQTEDHGTTLTWDAANRLAAATPVSGTATEYTYDAVDRVVSHTAGRTVTGYAYNGYDDSAAAALDGNGNVVQQFVALPGGVMATIQTSGTLWSYPDLHDNITVVTDNTGTSLNDPIAYDPWGQALSGSATPANAAGGNVLGAFGKDSKLTDTGTGITVLGARAYEAAEGRFLSVDPIENGCANNYVYVFGDPFSKSDLTGRFSCTANLSSHAAHANRYFASTYAGTVGGMWGIVGKVGWLGKHARGAGSMSGGFAAFGFNFGYSMATDGKWNWCQAAIEGAAGAAFGWLLG
ncbi:RHS repeat-associated core domain-containing protein [Streptomyces sp. NPDC008092]|uniref:RHS repeat-associated core domain-containing protein n=1 Tax=Streptomyces sp. NPDC008092 TaxID=3364808 RepID=UPI0036F03244